MPGIVDALKFAVYYVGLLLGVIFGVHTTFHPIGPRYRWQVWRRWHERELTGRN